MHYALTISKLNCTCYVFVVSSMAFIKPFPVVKKINSRPFVYSDLPPFTSSEYLNQTVVGLGSFGKVVLVSKNNEMFVIKQFNNTDADDLERKLFEKEARLLYQLSGCENVVKFHGFSAEEGSLLLEYCCFSFTPLQIDHESVHNLKELLLAGDRLSDYSGFEHLQRHMASDIACGLLYLHDRKIVHRDLKPHNILISNRHYSNAADFDTIQQWWNTRPVVAKLSDFGESRASLLQTRTALRSRTQNLNRGSPAYMAPEALLGTASSADVNDLKAMDVWSLGMTFFHLLNPGTRHPFSYEIDGSSAVPVIDQLKSFFVNKQLPNHMDKYVDMQV